MIKVVLKLCNIFLKNGTHSKLFHLIKDGKDKILYIHILFVALNPLSHDSDLKRPLR